MSGAVKRVSNAWWKVLRPVLRPLVRRLDDHLNDHLAQFMGQLSVWNSQQREAMCQIELLSDSMIREMARLQAQIALLEANLPNAANAPVAPPSEIDVKRLAPRQPSSQAA